ncbi:hypothetical protein ES708_28673 [subsurface metagenome]
MERSTLKKIYDFIILSLAGIIIILLIIYKIRFSNLIVIDFNDIDDQAQIFFNVDLSIFIFLPNFMKLIFLFEYKCRKDFSEER